MASVRYSFIIDHLWFHRQPTHPNRSLSIAGGMNYKAIGQQLGISQERVRQFISNFSFGWVGMSMASEGQPPAAVSHLQYARRYSGWARGWG